jgi:NTP pyrophosphatase (non-canonical NTP hydrolase)
MTLNDYQTEAKKTAMYPVMGARYVYPALGLCGESGEVAEKVKKIFRDFDGVLTEECKESLKKEAGDCLWYIANFCLDIGFTLEEVAQSNLYKLRDRQERGMLNGSGDTR